MTKKIFTILLILFINFTVLLTSCDTSETINTAMKTFFAMDTVMNVKIYGKQSPKELENIINEIISEVNRQDRIFSKFNEDSQLYGINHRKSRDIEITEEMYEILSEADKYSEMSGGAFDYTLGALIELWNIKGNSADGNPVVPDVVLIAEALTHTGYDKVILKNENGKFFLSISDNELIIDLGAIAKGYVSDKAAGICAGKNISGIISVGGNITVLGEKPDGSDFVVGVRDPEGEFDDYIGTFSLKNGESTSTSGSYERFFEADGKKYCHIIDNETGHPADKGIVSVTVIGESGTICDALSTACFVLGREEGSKLLDKIGYKYIWVDEEGNVFCTEDINFEENAE